MQNFIANLTEFQIELFDDYLDSIEDVKISRVQNSEILIELFKKESLNRLRIFKQSLKNS